jgi:imidazolonepropionase-like amidohydrolase
MVEFGMTPMQAIQSATSRAADLLGERGELGVVAPGAYADLIAVAGDPLQNVNVLKDVGFVMKDGAVFRSTLSSGGKESRPPTTSIQ